MNNPQKKVWVLRELSESQVKSYGANIIMNRRKKYWIGLFVVLLLWEIVIASMFKQGMVLYVGMLAPIIIIGWAFIYSANQAGKRLWNNIKDKEQPVKLEIK